MPWIRRLCQTPGNAGESSWSRPPEKRRDLVHFCAVLYQTKRILYHEGGFCPWPSVLLGCSACSSHEAGRFAVAVWSRYTRNTRAAVVPPPISKLQLTA